MGVITGLYQAANNVYHGFVRDDDGNITTFDPAGSYYTVAVSINPRGAITGSYFNQ